MLLRSADAYDSGDYAEASRLAGTIVKLIGDRTGKGGKPNANWISLTSHLGIKPLNMVDLSIPEMMNQQNLHGPLCIMGCHVAGADGITPYLDGFEGKVTAPLIYQPFEEWWESTVVRDCRGTEFSRRHIVETMRDKEDAHTDTTLETAYADVAYNNSMGITQLGASIKLDTNPARVVVRQIAHEVLRTFQPNSPIKYMLLHGLTVQPFILYKFRAKNELGEFVEILDRESVEFAIETTISPTIRKEWGKLSTEYPLPTQKKPSHDQVRHFEVQIVSFNHAPYPINNFSAKIKM